VGPVTLHLVDSNRTQPLQTWRFLDTPLIRIGRAPENEVVVSSPFVSRAHAYLRHHEGAWELCVLSQQGVFVDGQRIDALALREGTVFRLSAGGPFLRFSVQDEAERIGSSTISYTPDTPLLILDPVQRDRQVDEIARGEYFQQLRLKARQLRQESDTRLPPAAPRPPAP
jgi:pSer/pThr/pTyr-binding forkhead associated (FHA) protein